MRKLSVFLLISATCISLWAESNHLLSIELDKHVNANNELKQKRGEYEWLDAQLKYRFELTRLKTYADVDIRFYFSEQTFGNSLSQAYIDYRGESGSHFTFGRRILDWHPNERFWQLGHFNGLRNFDLADTKREGLTGFLYHSKSASVETQVFVSFLYLPTLNPPLREENGNIISESYWVKRPPSQISFSDHISDAKYNVNRPDVQDIVVQKSLGAKFAYHWSGGYLSAYAIYKPETALRINADAPVGTNAEVTVNANPIVNHHAIFGTTLRQDHLGFRHTAGLNIVDASAKLGQDFDALSIKLESQKTFNSEFFTILPKYDREVYGTYALESSFEGLKYEFNLIHYFSSHDRESDSFYGETIKWKTAFGGKALYPFTEDIFAKASLKIDLANNDVLLETEGIYRANINWFVTLGLQAIKAPKDRSYWSAYRSHDTIYGKVRYVF